MNDTTDHGELLATLHPSQARRVLAVGVLAGLGLLLLTFGLRNGAGGATALMLLFGGVVIWGAVRLWQSTTHSLILTAQALRSTDGQLVARVDNIASLGTGVLALKPAGGFSLGLRFEGSRVWYPGLWWRSGRRVGIGGVTQRHASRHMADQIAALIAARGSRA